MGLSYKRTLYVPPYNSKVRVAAIVGYAPFMSDDGNANARIGWPVVTLETLTTQYNTTNKKQKMTEKSTTQSLGPLTVALVDPEVPGLPVTHVEVRS